MAPPRRRSPTPSWTAFEGTGRQAYLAARQKRREEAQAEDRAVRPLAPPEECLSEEDIRRRQPRILLTNFRQLEVLTTRLPDVVLFAQAPIKYLVFDEAHTYGGATGAEVACLIRRVRSLAEKTADEITCIGTSATLSDPATKQGNDETARRFASRFFGVDPSRVTLVGESFVSREWPDRRYKPIVPHGDGMARLTRVLSAITEPVDLGAIRQTVEELTGQIFEPGDDWRESFPAGVCRKRVVTSAGLSTEPDWLHEESMVAVYLDGMSRGLHGDPKTARRDQLIRGMLELDDYTVIVVQSRDLDDPRRFGSTSRTSPKPSAGQIWRSRLEPPHRNRRYPSSQCFLASS